MNFKDPLFQDIRVRQAFNLAWDRTEYGQVYFGGDYNGATLVPTGTYFGRAENEIWDVLPGYGTGAKKKAEQEQAKKLLADAGYPNGLNMTITHSSWGIPGEEVFQRNLKAIGVNATLERPSDASQRWATGKFQLYYFPAALAIGDPDESVFNYYVPGGGRAFMGYDNPQLNSLAVLMSSETDPPKRKQLLRQVEDILTQDWAAVFPADGRDKWWYATKLHGFTAATTGLTLYSVGTFRGEKWWVE